MCLRTTRYSRALQQSPAKVGSLAGSWRPLRPRSCPARALRLDEIRVDYYVLVRASNPKSAEKTHATVILTRAFVELNCIRTAVRQHCRRAVGEVWRCA